MMRYVKTLTVKSCYHACTFFATDMDGMMCCHPEFDGKNAYDNRIITQQNSRGGNIPEKCPLRKGNTEIITQIKLQI